VIREGCSEGIVLNDCTARTKRRKYAHKARLVKRRQRK
jgi:hypothetical protein